MVRTVLLFGCGVLLIMGVGVGIGIGVERYRGVPLLIDEWICTTGEAPVLTDAGGTSCAPVDEPLTAGDRWDPLGNRPFECDGRPGWVRVSDGTDRTECFSAYMPIPDGWRLVG